MKRKNEQRQKFLILLREYSLLFLFVVVLFFISQQDKDPLAFHASQTLSSRLTEEFDSITTPDGFWTWAEEVMLPVLYPSLWYNGWKMKYLDRQFPLYTEAFRIGPPRLTQIRKAPASGEVGIDTFVDLGPSFWWDDAFKYVLASVVFVNTLALLRVVKFNKTIAHFLALPGAMKDDLMGFSLVSAIAFMAFSSSGMVVFGTHKKAFTNFIHTNFALFEMVLGSFDTEEILAANRYVGPVYFTFFMICIFIILVNFLMTIICDAIASRASIDDDYDQDLVDYIWTSFKEILGIHSAPINDETAGKGAY
ncbi:polycystin-2-like protein 1 [Branchiostoma floridae x Branchiostoma belcheri]